MPNGSDALAAFFCAEMPEWGYFGDCQEWTPERTAIEVLRRAKDAMDFYDRHAVTAPELRYLRLYRALSESQREALDAFGRHLLAEAERRRHA